MRKNWSKWYYIILVVDFNVKPPIFNVFFKRNWKPAVKDKTLELLCSSQLTSPKVAHLSICLRLAVNNNNINNWFHYPIQNTRCPFKFRRYLNAKTAATCVTNDIRWWYFRSGWLKWSPQCHKIHICYAIFLFLVSFSKNTQIIY